MEDLNISLIQTYLNWEDKERNIHHFEGLISNLNTETNLVVLPEMFTTGFSNNISLAESFLESPTRDWMHKIAKKNNVCIVGSFMVSDNNKYYNRLLAVLPDHTEYIYDKRHLFSLGNENNFFDAGNKQLTFEFKGWRICPLICYDLRFPVWSRQTIVPYDLLIYVANWPEKRIKAWVRLLRARAIENQAYVVGVNRIGTDGNEIVYNGGSCAFDLLGEWLANVKDEHEVINLSLSVDYLKKIRAQFPFLNDADRFKIDF